MYLFRTPPMGLGRFVQAFVDAGLDPQRLPERTWRRIHHGYALLLVLHMVLIVGLAAAYGHGAWHGVLEAVPVGFVLAMAVLPNQGRHERAGWAGIGLFASTVILLHLTEGHLLAQLHFAAVLAALGAYRSWTTLVLGLITVGVLHAVVGPRDPHAVYGHAEPATAMPILLAAQILLLLAVSAWVLLQGLKSSAVLRMQAISA